MCMFLWVQGFYTDVYTPSLSPSHVSTSKTHGPVQREAHWVGGVEEVKGWMKREEVAVERLAVWW